MTITKGSITKLSKLEGPDDQKKQIFKDLGDLAQYELLGEDVIVAIYAESNVLSRVKTQDGRLVELVGTDNRTTESRYQGKVGLLISKGPAAFKFYNNGQPYEGVIPDVGDWVVFIPSDGRELFLRDAGSSGDGVACRKMSWQGVFMRVADPRVVH